MSGKSTILVIDDDPGIYSLVKATLGDSHEVLHTENGPDGIAMARAHGPTAILQDISLSGMSGYEVCVTLKADADTQHIPVIFLSGLAELDDRLAAYEAGGEDFIGKPFDPVELLDKIAVAERHAGERQRLAADAQSAFSAAMTAMSSASEIGVVMHFLRASFALADYSSLADAIIDTCASYGLTCSVQLRGRYGVLSRNRQGASSPIEAGIHESLATCGRVVSLGNHTAINYDHATLLITDMPVDDSDRSGRLRDNLAFLAEAADARVRALDNELTVRAQQQALQRLINQTHAALDAIDARHRQQKATALEIMDAMLTEMDESFYHLGLSEGQEAAVSETLKNSTHKVFELLDRGLDIDQHLQTINKELAGMANGHPK